MARRVLLAGLAAMAGLLVASLTRPAHATPPAPRLDQMVHDAWGPRDGLPAGPVRAIAQTPDGYLWLGTSAGLARFDGVRFVTYRRDTVQALETDDVSSLAVDAAGRLWIGTYGGGVVILEDGRFRPMDPRLKLPHPVVTSLTATPRGDLWIGTIAGPARLRGGQLTSFERSGGAGLYVTSIVDTGRRVLATTLGGGLYEIGSSQVRRVPNQAPRSLNGRWILHESAGRALIATHGAGLWTWDGRGAPVPSTLNGALPDAITRSVARDATGHLWVASFGGVSRVAAGRIETFGRREGLSGALALVLFEDDTGSMWVGTDQGLDRFRAPALVHLSTADGLPNPRVHSVLRTRAGELLVGTEGGGIAGVRDGRVTRVVSRRDGLSSDYVIALAEDRAGGVWAGTIGDGVDYLHGGRIRHFGPERGLVGVSDIEVLPDGSVWFATLGGITIFRADRFERLAAASIGILGTARELLRAPDGTLWIGTDRGLFARRGARTREVALENDASPVVVDSLQQDATGVLWVGTTRGLRAVTAEGPRAWPVRAELNRAVRQVLDDATGRLWIATDSGLVVVSRAGLLADSSGRAVTIEVLDESAGLRSPLLDAGTLDSTGAPVFGSDDGIVRLAPRPATPTLAPRAIIEMARAGDARDIRPRRFRVPPGVRGFMATFTATRLPAPAQYTFQYRLLGLDEAWTPAGDARSARYSNLPPDSYTFELRVLDRNLRTVATDTIAVEVMPRWYETAWARVAGLIALCMLIASLHLWRLRLHRQREQALESTVALRTSELATANETLAQRHAEEQVRADRFVVIARVAAIMTAAPERDVLLDSTSKAIRLHLGYPDVAIALADPEADASQPTSSASLRATPGIVGLAAHLGTTQRQNAPVGDDHDVSRLAIPIIYGDELLGVLALGSTRPFDNLDVVSLEVVAENLAVALVNARLQEDARGLVLLQERQRLARDLHDNVTQILSSISLITQSLPTAYALDPTEATRRAERLGELAQLAFTEMRALLAELAPPGGTRPRPPSTHRDTLPLALRRLLSAMVPPPIALHLDLASCPVLSHSTEEALLRICQEAVSNAVRHSGASRIEVGVTTLGDTINLQVADDGRGIPLDPRKGMGLDSMRQRADSLGGLLSVERGTGPRPGTTVRLVLPLAPG